MIPSSCGRPYNHTSAYRYRRSLSKSLVRIKQLQLCELDEIISFQSVFQQLTHYSQTDTRAGNNCVIYLNSIINSVAVEIVGTKQYKSECPCAIFINYLISC